MNHNSVSDQRWHRSPNYPALSPETAKRLQVRIERQEGKIATLSATCDSLAKQNYEQEQRIRELEQHIAHLQSLTKSYEDLIVAKHGYVTPVAPEPAEPFSN